MSPTTPTISRYWMLTNEFTQNPYPILEAVRAQGPVQALSLPDGSRAWIVTRFEEARAALSDPRLSRDIEVHYRQLSARTGRLMTPPPEHANNLANVEPPRHSQLRKAVAFAFTPRRAEAMRPRVAEIADRLLDELESSGRPDLIGGFADPLPVISIAALMGVPAGAWPDFLEWSTLMRTLPPNDPTGRLDRCIADLSAYMAALIATKQQEPGDDLISALVHADEERRLTPTEVLSTGFGLMTGGNDTAGSLVGGVLAALLTHPAERAELLSRPDGGWGTAMDELVRYITPVANTLQRVSTEAVELGGVTIPADETVIISLLGTNRDPHQVPGNPDELDLSREKAAHLNFGFGIHYCTGAHLAKVITEVGTRRVFERFPGIRLAVRPDQLRYVQNVVVRPLVELPVVLR